MFGAARDVFKRGRRARSRGLSPKDVSCRRVMGSRRTDRAASRESLMAPPRMCRLCRRAWTRNEECFCGLFFPPPLLCGRPNILSQALSLGTRKRPRQAGGFNKAYDRTGKQVHSDFAAGGAQHLMRESSFSGFDMLIAARGYFFMVVVAGASTSLGGGAAVVAVCGVSIHGSLPPLTACGSPESNKEFLADANYRRCRLLQSSR